ncbi:hypothetical protein EPD60_09380 [Flaviaesturariibacter flavus]|uniref:Lipocalin-like domain-containing protein n=1 Tax=Flaviaesturariibacter flavus TaxID=2502780 RepID=A0A4R1BB96_9BACT|nr:hypothetical protein [Flaviaesturariibacter flavus]TCJ14208.1 hypothetical protein EPD60_09380 [Flaviaesturariibacter flavus]
MRICFFIPFLLLLACSRPRPSLSPDAVAGTWLKKAEAADGQNLWCLYYYDTCALDDAWRFATDGSYTVIDTGLRCTVTPPGGNWQLLEGRLRLDGTDYTVLRCDRELWLEGRRLRNGFAQRHELRFRRP